VDGTIVRIVDKLPKMTKGHLALFFYACIGVALEFCVPARGHTSPAIARFAPWPHAGGLAFATVLAIGGRLLRDGWNLPGGAPCMPRTRALIIIIRIITMKNDAIAGNLWEATSDAPMERFDALWPGNRTYHEKIEFERYGNNEWRLLGLTSRLIARLTVAHASANSRVHHGILRFINWLDADPLMDSAQFRMLGVNQTEESAKWHDRFARAHHNNTYTAWLAERLSPNVDVVIRNIRAVIEDRNLAMQLGGSDDAQREAYNEWGGALVKNNNFTKDKALAFLKNVEPSIRAYFRHVSGGETLTMKDVVGGRVCIPYATLVPAITYLREVSRFDAFLTQDMKGRRWPHSEMEAKGSYPKGHLVVYDAILDPACAPGFRVLTAEKKMVVVPDYTRFGVPMPPRSFSDGPATTGEEARFMRRSGNGARLQPGELSDAHGDGYHLWRRDPVADGDAKFNELVSDVIGSPELGVVTHGPFRRTVIAQPLK
jgi:hypothetical protein